MRLNFSWNGVPIKSLGDHWDDIGGKEYELSPEIQRAFTSTKHNHDNMNDDVIKKFNVNLEKFNYNIRKKIIQNEQKILKNKLQ